LPRYPTVPTVRLDRVAVDQSFKGQSFGGALLVDVIDRAARAEIAAYAVIVIAKDEGAVTIYLRQGLFEWPKRALAGERLQLNTPMRSCGN
jgi:GNAT superfamily N-acetyltransferase